MTWIGNETTLLVHTDDCEMAEGILYRVEFDELHHALGQGYSEAQCCLTDRPYYIILKSNEQRAANRKELKSVGCAVCGNDKYVELAHIVPRSLGGVHRIPLCPNHHKAYDEGHLEDIELDRLRCSVNNSHGFAASVSVKRMHGMVKELRQ